MNAPLSISVGTDFKPGRLWSLWDMINFELRRFLDALADLNIAQVRTRMAIPEAFPSDGELSLINENLERIREESVRLDMPTVIGRLARIAAFFSFGARSTNGALSHEINELFDAVERDAREQFFCHYRQERVGFLLKVQEDWASVFVNFKSARTEIEAGVDCYALGHNAACVFHMARIGEIGLRAIGRERGVKTVRGNVPIAWGTWGNVFQAIEPEIKIIRNKPNRHQKDAALAFYDTVLSDLHAIQSLYRDPTMHFRGTYDDGEAQSAMFRARSLMKTLASKLDENSTRKIPWSAWK